MESDNSFNKWFGLWLITLVVCFSIGMSLQSVLNFIETTHAIDSGYIEKVEDGQTIWTKDK